jgi:hypothetical protein
MQLVCETRDGRKRRRHQGCERNVRDASCKKHTEYAIFKHKNNARVVRAICAIWRRHVSRLEGCRSEVGLWSMPPPDIASSGACKGSYPSDPFSHTIYSLREERDALEYRTVRADSDKIARQSKGHRAQQQAPKADGALPFQLRQVRRDNPAHPVLAIVNARSQMRMTKRTMPTLRAAWTANESMVAKREYDCVNYKHSTYDSSRRTSRVLALEAEVFKEDDKRTDGIKVRYFQVSVHRMLSIRPSFSNIPRDTGGKSYPEACNALKAESTKALVGGTFPSASKERFQKGADSNAQMAKSRAAKPPSQDGGGEPGRKPLFWARRLLLGSEGSAGSESNLARKVGPWKMGRAQSVCSRKADACIWSVWRGGKVKYGPADPSCETFAGSDTSGDAGNAVALLLVSEACCTSANPKSVSGGANWEKKASTHSKKIQSLRGSRNISRCLAARPVAVSGYWTGWRNRSK